MKKGARSEAADFLLCHSRWNSLISA